jgi:GMP synthase-like glutamine amidotransferase
MKSLNIHYFQHVPFEGLGYIEKWASEKGHKLTSTKFYEKYTLPGLEDLDWLIIMGGPMGVYDEDKFAWIKKEKEFIKSAIKADKTVIGICLGAQLIAEVLGARVYPNVKKEIGWFPVSVTNEGKENDLLKEFPDSFTVFHWHGDTFDIPNNSIHLLESKACKNQAFLYKKKVLGFQFHLEANLHALKEIIKNCKNELIPDTYIQDEQTILIKEKETERTNKILSVILEKLNR